MSVVLADEDLMSVIIEHLGATKSGAFSTSCKLWRSVAARHREHWAKYRLTIRLALGHEELSEDSVEGVTVLENGLLFASGQSTVECFSALSAPPQAPAPADCLFSIGEDDLYDVAYPEDYRPPPEIVAGLANDGDHLFVVHQRANRILKYRLQHDSPAGELVGSVSANSDGSETFAYPHSIVLVGSRLLVTDMAHNRLVEINKDTMGWVRTLATKRDGVSLRLPQGIAYDGAELLAVADLGNHRVVLLTLQGKLVRSIQDDAIFRFPKAVALANDLVYVSAMSDSCIHVFTQAGGHLQAACAPTSFICSLSVDRAARFRFGQIASHVFAGTMRHGVLLFSYDEIGNEWGEMGDEEDEEDE
tara:strand:- start:704 stop:1786 length:1083 start_codon:yes stop_codon:yes gene_type:complete